MIFEKKKFNMEHSTGRERRLVEYTREVMMTFTHEITNILIGGCCCRAFKMRSMAHDFDLDLDLDLSSRDLLRFLSLDLLLFLSSRESLLSRLDFLSLDLDLLSLDLERDRLE